MSNKIIYSLRVMTKLVNLGYVPIETLKNPKDIKYNCWLFAATPEFMKDLDKILKGMDGNDK